MLARTGFWRFIILLLVALSGLTSNAASKAKVVPFHAQVAFSGQSTERPWSAPLQSTDGRTLYVLSLEPDYEVGHQIEGLDLVLRYPRDRRKNSNLLAPVGIWHGLQNYMFPAGDFLQGVEKATFGKSRTISVKKLGLEIRVTILKASISQLTDGSPKLDGLELDIGVENINP